MDPDSLYIPTEDEWEEYKEYIFQYFSSQKMEDKIKKLLDNNERLYDSTITQKDNIQVINHIPIDLDELRKEKIKQKEGKFLVSAILKFPSRAIKLMQDALK